MLYYFLTLYPLEFFVIDILYIQCYFKLPHLITGGAAWLEALGVVAAAEERSVPPEVDEVNQQLLADAAGEAARVPGRLLACPVRSSLLRTLEEIYTQRFDKVAKNLVNH